MLKNFFYAALVLVAFQLTGCATGASAPNMTYQYSGNAKPINRSLINNISVGEVTGGEKTNPMWKSEISNENFKTALQQSLENANLYSSDNAKYILSANLVNLDQPNFSFNTTVKAVVHYALSRANDNKVIYSTDIPSSYTAPVSSDFYGVARLRDANEGVAKASIQQLITNLYQLRN